MNIRAADQKQLKTVEHVEAQQICLRSLLSTAVPQSCVRGLKKHKSSAGFGGILFLQTIMGMKLGFEWAGIS